MQLFYAIFLKNIVFPNQFTVTQQYTIQEPLASKQKYLMMWYIKRIFYDRSPVKLSRNREV
jgi:hypothetical protein